MNEAEWLSSADPYAMLSYFRGDMPRQAIAHLRDEEFPVLVSDRKLRLFAVAVCRQVEDGVECTACKGYGTTGKQGSKSFPDCLDCYGSGWVPRGPTARGDWVIDLLTGKG